MSLKILVLNGDEKESQELCSLLEQANYNPLSLDCTEDLQEKLTESKFLAVILDVDSITLDNRTIRELTLKYPEVCFLCTSKDRFHPELKEAISHHIYACLNKPIDRDELLYWLKCVGQNDAESRDPPTTPP